MKALAAELMPEALQAKTAVSGATLGTNEVAAAGTVAEGTSHVVIPTQLVDLKAKYLAVYNTAVDSLPAVAALLPNASAVVKSDMAAMNASYDKWMKAYNEEVLNAHSTGANFSALKSAAIAFGGGAILGGVAGSQVNSNNDNNNEQPVQQHETNHHDSEVTNCVEDACDLIVYDQ